MNAPMTVIKMMHITIIHFYVNLFYSCMYANKSYLLDVGPPRLY